MNFLKDYRKQISNEVNGHIHDWINHVPQPTMIGGEPLMYGGGAKSNISQPLGYTSPYGPSTLATGDSWSTRQLRGGEMEEIMSESDDDVIGGGFWKDFSHGFEKGFTDTAKIFTAPAVALGATMETGDPMKGAEAFNAVNNVLKGKGMTSDAESLLPTNELKPILTEYKTRILKKSIKGEIKKGKALKKVEQKMEKAVEKAEKAVEKETKIKLKIKERLKAEEKKAEELKEKLKREQEERDKEAQELAEYKKKERAEADKKEKPKRVKKEKIETPEDFLKNLDKTHEEVMKAMKEQEEHEKREAHMRKEQVRMATGGAMVGKDLASRKPIPVSDVPYIKKLRGGGVPNKRAEVVKQVMKEKGMKMIEASKYVKDHGLYKK